MHGGGGWRRPSTVDPSQQPSNHEDSNEVAGEEDDLHYGQVSILSERTFPPVNKQRDLR